ncbi:MAG: DUF2752 domain-containing protein [Ruminococcus sp.]|jgi:hypothetical protein
MLRELLMHPCFFYQYTGLYCPGCGGTRAVLELMRGHFLTSLWYHPIVLYTVALAVWYALSHGIEKATCGRIKTGMVFKNSYLYLGLGIIFANWIFKNILLLVFEIRL